MILVWLLVIPIAGGILAWGSVRHDPRWARWIALAALSADLVLAVSLWAPHYDSFELTASGVSLGIHHQDLPMWLEGPH